MDDCLASLSDLQLAVTKEAMWVDLSGCEMVFLMVVMLVNL